MTEYGIYQRDPITGHMNIIRRIDCRTDDEATRQARYAAAGMIETVVYEGQRVVAQFQTMRPA